MCKRLLEQGMGDHLYRKHRLWNQYRLEYPTHKPHDRAKVGNKKQYLLILLVSHCAPLSLAAYTDYYPNTLLLRNKIRS
jgi:hypothetical protein